MKTLSNIVYFTIIIILIIIYLYWRNKHRLLKLIACPTGTNRTYTGGLTITDNCRCELNKIWNNGDCIMCPTGTSTLFSGNSSTFPECKCQVEQQWYNDECVTPIEKLGRYVRIRRINNTTGPINIANFIIKSKDGQIWTTPSLQTTVKPLKKISDTEYSYGKFMIDTDTTTFTETGEIISSVIPVNTELDKGYVQIDLGQNRMIGSIELYHNGNEAAAETLNDTEIIIISESGNIVYKQVLQKSKTQRVITVHDVQIGPDTIFNNAETFTYPNCKPQGCLTYDDKVIKDYKYNTSDGRCFKAKEYNASSILDRILIDDKTININTYFDSCNESADTRYIPAVGRFVRLERNDDKETRVSQFEVRGSTYQFLPPIDVQVKPSINSMMAVYENLKTTNNTTNIISGVAKQTYIQLDLGSNVPIREIIIKPDSTDINGSTYLNGATLYIIKEDGTITYQVTLNNNILLVSTFIAF